MKERKANARQCGKDLGMTLPWIIDDMKSTIQKAYGGLPYCAYIITSEGKVFYKEAWANASNIDKKLKEMYSSKPEFKTKAAKYLEKNILAEKEPDRRAHLMVRLARLACKDARKSLAAVFRKEKETGVKTELVKALADTTQKEYIEFLINLLGDAEEKIRTEAAAALKKLTGETLGFDPGAEEEKRKESTAKWKAWWGKNRDFLVWSGELERFIIKK